MNRLYLLLLTLSLSTFFLLVPDYGPDRYKEYYVGELGKNIMIDTYLLPTDAGRIAFFPLKPDVKLFPDTYIFLLGFHLITFFLSLALYEAEQDYKWVVAVYVVMELIDLFFYVIAYGDPFENITLTWNITKISIFLLAIFRQRYAKR
jgi:hypothetical protein